MTSNPHREGRTEYEEYEDYNYIVGYVCFIDKRPSTRSRSSAPRASSDAPITTPPADQRRMAWVFSANDRFANSFGEGAPLRSVPFLNDEFHAAAQMRYGVELTCLKSFTNLPLKSNNASAIDKTVDAFGKNIKKLVGAEGGGTTANHNSFISTISAWCRRAQIPHRGGTSGTPRTCKGLFSAYTQALHGRNLPEVDIRVLNKIIPDLLFDLRSAGEAFEDMKQMGLSGA